MVRFLSRESAITVSLTRFSFCMPTMNAKRKKKSNIISKLKINYCNIRIALAWALFNWHRCNFETTKCFRSNNTNSHFELSHKCESLMLFIFFLFVFFVATSLNVLFEKFLPWIVGMTTVWTKTYCNQK